MKVALFALVLLGLISISLCVQVSVDVNVDSPSTHHHNNHHNKHHQEENSSEAEIDSFMDGQAFHPYEHVKKNNFLQVGSVQAPAGPINDIALIATGSQCAKHEFAQRGLAPQGYLAGMALVFAKAACNPSRPDVQLVSEKKTGNDQHDALSWYNSNFNDAGMHNDADAFTTYRHTIALQIGLGMRESSGQYCCGRDTSASFTASDSAEAGTFQTSWGVRRASPTILTNMFNQYSQNQNGCFLDIFKQGVKCRQQDAKNWGTGTGMQWQKLTKQCPAFAAEYASVVLRTSGGTQGEFGPIRKKAAELRPECDQMLQKVQDYIAQHPDACATLVSHSG